MARTSIFVKRLMHIRFGVDPVCRSAKMSSPYIWAGKALELGSGSMVWPPYSDSLVDFHPSQYAPQMPLILHLVISPQLPSGNPEGVLESLATTSYFVACSSNSRFLARFLLFLGYCFVVFELKWHSSYFLQIRIYLRLKASQKTSI